MQCLESIIILFALNSRPLIMSLVTSTLVNQPGTTWAFVTLMQVWNLILSDHRPYPLFQRCCVEFQSTERDGALNFITRVWDSPARLLCTSPRACCSLPTGLTTWPRSSAWEWMELTPKQSCRIICTGPTESLSMGSWKGSTGPTLNTIFWRAQNSTDLTDDKQRY